MTDIPLAAPASTDELYLARGEDIAPGRPLMTGDVLVDVDVGADDHDGTVMVVAHPCSMRGRRGRLLPKIAVAPVRPYQEVPLDRWPMGHYKVLPLPELRSDEDQARAVHLLELCSADSASLARERRILALTDRGIHVLQQRLVYSLTRYAVGLDKLQQQSTPVLLEAELEEEWVEDLSPNADATALAAASEAFCAFMDDGYRDALKDATRRTDAVRRVRQEIRRRRQSAANGEDAQV